MNTSYFQRLSSQISPSPLSPHILDPGLAHSADMNGCGTGPIRQIGTGSPPPGVPGVGVPRGTVWFGFPGVGWHANAHTPLPSGRRHQVWSVVGTAG